MRKKGMFAIFIAVIMAFCCLAGSLAFIDVPTGGDAGDDGAATSAQSLQIFDSDLHLTQDDAVSRIKAEYLKENGGYRADDDVVAIIDLEDDSLIDSYLAGHSDNMTVRDYVTSSSAATRTRRLDRAQDAFINELVSKNLITAVENKYTTVLNGIAVSLPYGNISKVEALDSVKSVILSDTYNRPQTVTPKSGSAADSASDIINEVDVYDTGIFDSSSVSALNITGKGTAVAVLDSGFDCSHSVFARQPEGELWITQQDVTNALVGSNAAKFTADIEMTDVWYSNKIPFAYDYADKDDDVFPYASEHGTHVAGIIGGCDDLTERPEGIVGVAVDTQLVLMKVFPDYKEGAKTEDILAALEDSVRLGVVCINMSLGSSCGFAREEDGSKINEVYDAINDSGISLLVAASNSYSSAFGGDQGNTNKVTNPDSSTVGSPSTYAAALSVASISGVMSNYIYANDEQIVFFRESSSITGKENDFVGELYTKLGIGDSEVKTLEYVTIPGIGDSINYEGLDVKGKIALVKRGESTFEDKARYAAGAGAVACIIYNNIEGEIAMSMGKSIHIPTMSVTKEVGTRLASRATGKITLSKSYKAGPFMSDFSSWGPLPDLQIKPEITAHGGRIRSSVPGGGYDEQSGTSMATPNLCGIVVLIRQFLKDKFPDYTPKQIVTLANQMLMSTATIVINEEANPYSPRKQGAGLASLSNVVNTKAYLSVDGKDRTKLELKDDPKKTGKYTMNFNIVNVSDEQVSYDLSVVGMTETVSTSDVEFVAEKPQILSGGFTASIDGNGTLSGNTVTVGAGKTAAVTVVYTLTADDKAMMDKLFPYGMYVEGFVKLTAKGDTGVNLNAPFLAFYGDWTQAPMFDKTFYDVESEAYEDSIDEEDKIKADYYATTPYATYFHNYIIPLGAYLYNVPYGYDEIPAVREHIAISNELATLDGFSSVYSGLLRGAKTMTYTITDKLTGEVLKEFVDYNAGKSHSEGGTPLPNYEFLNWKSSEFNFVNNRQYEFKMVGLLDYGDGGLTTNVNNTFSFDFTFDNEAPIIKSVEFEKEYDTTTKKDRYYITMVVYDNHYVQSVTPILFTSSSSYSILSDDPIPVYSEKGKDNRVRFEITEQLDNSIYDALITGSLAFSVDDYALNSNIFFCQLPGTKGDLKFTKDGDPDGTPLTILTIYEDEIVDLTQYLSTSDASVDPDKEYLKYIDWASSNENIAVVEQGQVRGISAGRTTVSATGIRYTVSTSTNEEEHTAYVLINVKAREAEPPADGGEAVSVSETKNGVNAVKSPAATRNDVENASDAKIESIRFAYFETKYAHLRGAQTSMIGSTGSKIFLSSISSRLEMYPGEKIKLFYDIEPWYVDEKYEKTYESTNDRNVTVDRDGTVTAIRKGNATIRLRLKGSNLTASLPITVNDPFIIENRTLIAYKGTGGDVVIPDDEGIMYIGPYAFCLYDIDTSIVLTEEDYDANKIPSFNNTITSVTIPDGVEEVQKYAFHNCTLLEKVVLPDTIKFVREYAFYKCTSLDNINLEDVLSIGTHCFDGCTSLVSVDIGKAYAIGARGFADCTKLATIDLSALRNTGTAAFAGCTSLGSAMMNEHTKLSVEMFAESGLTEIDIYERVGIPDLCFAKCKQLERAALHNDLVFIGEGAFAECSALTDFACDGVAVNRIGTRAFEDCAALGTFTLPACEVEIESFAFRNCASLTTVEIPAGTVIKNADASIFSGSPVATFNVDSANAAYKIEGDFLLDSTGEEIIAASIGVPAALVIDAKYKKIGPGAFGGKNITSLTVSGKDTEIGAYAFEGCKSLQTVTLPADGVPSIGKRAFNNCSALTAVDNIGKVMSVGDYAFANTALTTAEVASEAEYGEGVFLQSKLETVTVGSNATFGLGAFQDCAKLTTVDIRGEGGVHFGESCFANCTLLSTIDMTKLDGTLERETFYNCRSLTTADLASVEHIGKYAFAECASLTTVNMPKVKTIGDGAFAKYEENGKAPAIVTLVFPNTLTEIGTGAFIACEALTSVTIPSGVASIKDYTFTDCINLKSVVLPDSLKTIGQYAFAGCRKLDTINLEHVKEFGSSAFLSAAALAKADLSSAEKIGFASFGATSLSGHIVADDLVYVGDYAFQSAPIRSFTAGKLAHIGIAAFQYNSRMTEFVFSKDVSYIGPAAFNGCSALRAFYYDVDGINTSDGKINDYARLSAGVLYTTLPNGDIMLSSIPAAMNIKTFVLMDRTVAIELYAGNDNKYIENVVLADSLKSIGNYAFNGCANLKSVEFRSFTAPVLESAYIAGAQLQESDPGYELLHSQYNLFGFELCYYTFKDLAGKTQPIEMILPANSGLIGYDTVIYQAYFGKVEDAERSNYVAMDKNLTTFIDCAKQIARITTITLADESVVNSAIAALNATEQTAVEYGYSEDEWAQMIKTVNDAKDKINSMKPGYTPEPGPVEPVVSEASRVGAIIAVCIVVALFGALLTVVIVKKKEGIE